MRGQKKYCIGRLKGIILICLPLVIFPSFIVSCTSVPEYPVSPPPTVRVLPVGEQTAFHIVRDVLLADSRLEINTIDTKGRIIAYEKTSGFIFWQHRTILDFFLEPIDPTQTRITMYLRAEQYESGGLTRPAGWYASPDIDTFLGEDVLSLIQKAAEKTTKEQS
jgi:hypothetical protein